MEQKPAHSTEDRYWSAVCYVPVFNIVTCTITAVRKSNSEFCLLHARQGLVLFGFWFATIIVGLFSPILSLMLWGAALLLHALGALSAYSGSGFPIPVVAQLAKKIPADYIFETLTGRVDKEMRKERRNAVNDDSGTANAVKGAENQVEVSEELANNVEENTNN